MSIKKLMETYKKDTVLLGPIQRHLLLQGEFEGERRRDVIHPSELCKSDVCDRSIYYRLSGWKVPKDSNAFQLEVIFAQGHGYHDKWQNWVWDIGMLRGRYRCLACSHGDWSNQNTETRWVTTSPDHCPKCGASRYHLQYGEVPLFLPKYQIGGHSDGDLDLDPDDDPLGVPSDPLLEIKSVGAGTIRYEAPKLIAKHTKKVLLDGDEKKWTDWDKLWKDIRRPFMSHLKQGAFYCLAKGRERMVYVYEYKPTGAQKEFTVTPDFEMIEDELEMCLDILYAVEKGVPPKCRNGGCAQCEAYEKLARGGEPDEQTGPEGREDPDAGASEGTAREEGVEDPGEAPGRDARARGRRRVQRVGRPRGDRGDADVHSLGGLLDRAARSGRDHGSGSGEDPSADQGHEDAEHRRAERTDYRSQGSRRVVRRRG